MVGWRRVPGDPMAEYGTMPASGPGERCDAGSRADTRDRLRALTSMVKKAILGLRNSRPDVHDSRAHE
jgi:hypothetical protein